MVDFIVDVLVTILSETIIWRKEIINKFASKKKK